MTTEFSRPGHRRAFSSQISGIISGPPIEEEEPPIELQITRNGRPSQASTVTIGENEVVNFDPSPEVTTDVSGPTAPNGIRDTSPKANGTVAKKKPNKKKRNLPSSRGTVLTIVGFFLSGLMLILSGVIVLAVEDHRAFRVAAGVMLTLGALFVSVCLFLQQKNINKLSDTMKHDLFRLFNSKNG